MQMVEGGRSIHHFTEYSYLSTPLCIYIYDACISANPFRSLAFARRVVCLCRSSLFSVYVLFLTLTFFLRSLTRERDRETGRQREEERERCPQDAHARTYITWIGLSVGRTGDCCRYGVSALPLCLSIHFSGFLLLSLPLVVSHPCNLYVSYRGTCINMLSLFPIIFFTDFSFCVHAKQPRN